MNKNKMVLEMILLGVVAVFIITLMFSMMNGNIGFPIKLGETTEEKVISKKEYSTKKIKYIDMDTISADVFLYQSEGKDIKVEIYGSEKDADKYQVEVEEQTLKVVQKKENNFCIGFCYGNQKINLYLPDTYQEKIKIHSISGDVISKIASSLDLQTVSGDIHLESASSLKAKTTSGDMKIRKLGNFSLETVSGDIEIDDVTLTKDATIHTVSGNVEIAKTNDIYMITHTTSGDVDIQKNNRYANVELSVTTTSGDIEIG